MGILKKLFNLLGFKKDRDANEFGIDNDKEDFDFFNDDEEDEDDEDNDDEEDDDFDFMSYYD